MEHGLFTLLAGQRGHFRMESGYHTDQLWELDRLFDDESRIAPYVAALAMKLQAQDPEAICGPQTGGARLARLVADRLNCACIPVDRIGSRTGDRTSPARYVVPEAWRHRIGNQRVAIVDDAISAGSAVRATYRELLACGALPVALGALIVFGTSAAEFARGANLPPEACAHGSLGMWLPAQCPLCAAGTPLAGGSNPPVSQLSAPPLTAPPSTGTTAPANGT